MTPRSTRAIVGGASTSSPTTSGTRIRLARSATKPRVPRRWNRAGRRTPRSGRTGHAEHVNRREQNAERRALRDVLRRDRPGRTTWSRATRCRAAARKRVPHREHGAVLGSIHDGAPQTKSFLLRLDAKRESEREPPSASSMPSTRRWSALQTAVRPVDVSPTDGKRRRAVMDHEVDQDVAERRSRHRPRPVRDQAHTRGARSSSEEEDQHRHGERDHAVGDRS